jgi:phosphatidylglycerophosphate synthase
MRRGREIIPHALSLSRIPLGLAFLLLYDTVEPWRYWASIGIAMVALVTDIADGRLARRWHVTSDAGGLIDGLGDKAFYVAVYLVIAAKQPGQDLLLWGLIFREVALYALRTIDGDRTRHTKQLRWASLAYAGVIRVYFLSFFVTGLFAVTRQPAPALLDYGHVFGYIALLFGFVGVAKLAHDISEKP